jgi:hypothetical protein
MVAETKCKVILEADAHDIKTMSKVPVNKALKLIKLWNLEKNLINRLSLK